jgi:hypothetical protein
MVADAYDAEGEAAVTEKYHIAKDHVHTVKQGALLNASLVAKGIGELNKTNLKKYLLKSNI